MKLNDLIPLTNKTTQGWVSTEINKTTQEKGQNLRTFVCTTVKCNHFWTLFSLKYQFSFWLKEEVFYTMPATKKRKIKPSKKANPVFWPCGICRMNCQVSSICCDLCNSWYHPQCENLTLQEFEMFAINGDLAYTCNGCFRDDVPKEYCFTAALNRLTEVRSW